MSCPLLSAFPYDEGNIFARILRREVPAKILHETDHTLVFQDVFPKAPVHVLMIPKGPYSCADAFWTYAPEHEVLDFCRALGHISTLVHCQEQGFRLITNQGRDGGQEVPHFHVHFVSGRALGPMLCP